MTSLLYCLSSHKRGETPQVHQNKGETFSGAPGHAALTSIHIRVYHEPLCTLLYYESALPQQHHRRLREGRRTGQRLQEAHTHRRRGRTPPTLRFPEASGCRRPWGAEEREPLQGDGVWIRVYTAVMEGGGGCFRNAAGLLPQEATGRVINDVKGGLSPYMVCNATVGVGVGVT